MGQSKLERDYQSDLIKKLKLHFPGSLILKNDSGYLQGICDLTIFFGPCWAMLEVKAKRPTKASDFEPNQEHYIQLTDNMSFGACIYPENEGEVLDGLQRFFQQSLMARRNTRQARR